MKNLRTKCNAADGLFPLPPGLSKRTASCMVALLIDTDEENII